MTTTADALSAKLAALKRQREVRDRHKETASESEREYRRLEADVMETMLSADPPMTSVRAEGLGQFVIQTRHYISPQDYPAIMEWAQADGLINTQKMGGNGDLFAVIFEPVTETDEDSGVTVTKLVSGAFKLDASKATLAEHAKSKLDEDNIELPGLRSSTARFIQIRS